MQPIILLVGHKGSGKDTVAELICKNFNAQQLALADPIKRFIHQVFKMPVDVLWGPSFLRENLIHQHFVDNKEAILDIINNMDRLLFHRCDLPESFYFPENTLPKLKQICTNLLLAGVHKGVDVRSMLRAIGTDYGRKRDGFMWLSYAERTAAIMLRDGTVYTPDKYLRNSGYKQTDMVVITDGRFYNEITHVKGLAGGKLIKVVNPTEGSTDSDISETDQTKIPDFMFDAIIYNNKSFGKDALEQQVIEAVNWLFPHPPVFEAIDALFVDKATE